MIPNRKSETIILALLPYLMWAGGPVSAQAKAKPPQPLEPVPSARQLQWQENELTLFVHFGMNTFTG
jgi:alpha-L-fucosidase